MLHRFLHNKTAVGTGLSGADRGSDGHLLPGHCPA